MIYLYSKYPINLLDNFYCILFNTFIIDLIKTNIFYSILFDTLIIDLIKTNRDILSNIKLFLF